MELAHVIFPLGEEERENTGRQRGNVWGGKREQEKYTIVLLV